MEKSDNEIKTSACNKHRNKQHRLHCSMERCIETDSKTLFARREFKEDICISTRIETFNSFVRFVRFMDSCMRHRESCNELTRRIGIRIYANVFAQNSEDGSENYGGADSRKIAYYARYYYNNL